MRCNSRESKVPKWPPGGSQTGGPALERFKPMRDDDVDKIRASRTRKLLRLVLVSGALVGLGQTRSRAAAGKAAAEAKPARRFGLCARCQLGGGRTRRSPAGLRASRGKAAAGQRAAAASETTTTTTTTDSTEKVRWQFAGSSLAVRSRRPSDWPKVRSKPIPN